MKARRPAYTRKKGSHRRRPARPLSVSQAMPPASPLPWNADLHRLYDLMFGASGSVEQEYRSYQEYYGVDPRNRI